MCIEQTDNLQDIILQIDCCMGTDKKLNELSTFIFIINQRQFSDG